MTEHLRSIAKFHGHDYSVVTGRCVRCGAEGEALHVECPIPDDGPDVAHEILRLADDGCPHHD
jgi:hypothetical protein